MTAVTASTRTAWHVNTTMRGGGVAEILEALVGGDFSDYRTDRYVTSTDVQLFEATKRIHHRLHGVDAGPLPDATDLARWRRFTTENLTALCRLISPGDLIVLHDPQTLPMARELLDLGFPVAWRCHIGTTRPTETSALTWDFLSQFFDDRLLLVFSDDVLVPTAAAGLPVRIIRPSINPLAPKNLPMEPAQVRATIAAMGLDGTPPSLPGLWTASESAVGDDPVVVQISRWDPLKDMTGVAAAFAEHGLAAEAHLVLCGPSPEGVADDPEALQVLNQVRALRDALPAGIRRRLHLVCTDLTDEATNAQVVNALQRRAAVVTQKSLQEGFGLTVTEAMLKACPIVASRIGGIPAQIVDGESGLLLDDPADGAAFAAAVRSLLRDRVAAGVLGRNAAARVRELFTTSREAQDHSLLYAALAARSAPRPDADLAAPLPDADLAAPV